MPSTAGALNANGIGFRASSVASAATTPFVAQTASAGTAGNAKTLSASLTAAPAAGSLLVAYIGNGDASTVTTAPSGWTPAVDVAGHSCSAMTGGAGTQGEQVYIHTVAAGEAAAPYTFGFSASTSYAVTLLEVRNAQATNSIAACGSVVPAKQTSTSALSSAKLGVTAINELPLVGYAPSTSSLTFTPASGWTGKVYNTAQTKWMSLEVESGPLTKAVGPTFTPTTTVSSLGSGTIVFAPSVDMLIAPAPVGVVSTAAPAVAQSATAGTTGNATSVSAVFTAAPNTGSLLVAYIGNGDASTVTTAPSGWSAAVDVNGNACKAMSGGANAQGEQVYLHTVAAGEGIAPYTFSFANSAGSPYAIAMLEVRNVQATNPIAACGAVNPAQGTATASLASAKLTATAANQLPISGYAPSTSGLTFARTSGWSGASYNGAATPWLTLDVESGPLTSAVGSTVTPVTSASNLSTANIVYAPAVTVLITGVTVATTGTPAATPTPAPVAAATAGPSAGTIQSDVPWAAAFRPYGTASYINIPMSNQTNPTLVANSDSIIAHAIQGTSDGQQMRVSDIDLNNGSVSDNDHPWFVASSTDPTIKVTCTQYCSDAVSTMQIPAKARPGNQGDSHITVIQPNGEEYDTWQTRWPSGNWTNGATMTTSTVSDCGNFYTGRATTADGYAATVGGACLQAGNINYNEAFSGIKHALFLRVTCGSTNTYQYPAPGPFDEACSDGQPSYVNGSHVWSDLTDAQVNALTGLPGTANDVVMQKSILRALHDYGGYVLDSAGSSNGHGGAPQVGFEDSGSYTALGTTAPWQTYGAANGWQLQQFGTAKFYQFADSWNPLDSAGVGGWASHLHLVDPCYAHGSC